MQYLTDVSAMVRTDLPQQIQDLLQQFETCYHIAATDYAVTFFEEEMRLVGVMIPEGLNTYALARFTIHAPDIFVGVTHAEAELCTLVFGLDVPGEDPADVKSKLKEAHRRVMEKPDRDAHEASQHVLLAGDAAAEHGTVPLSEVEGMAPAPVTLDDVLPMLSPGAVAPFVAG